MATVLEWGDPDQVLPVELEDLDALVEVWQERDLPAINDPDDYIPFMDEEIDDECFFFGERAIELVRTFDPVAELDR